MRIWALDMNKFRVAYSRDVFLLPPSAFRLWMLLQYDSRLRTQSFKERAATVNTDVETIRKASYDVSRLKEGVTGYLPSYLIQCSLPDSAVKMLAWLWVTANEQASNRLYLHDATIAEALGCSRETVKLCKRKLNGRYIQTKVRAPCRTFCIRRCWMNQVC